MRQSRHTGKTVKEDPKDAQTAAHRLMLRGGYIRQTSPGVYTHMPFLLRTLNKIAQIIREQMNSVDFEELLMPALQPNELWVESNRWERYAGGDGVTFVFRDRRGAMVCLAPAYDEVVTDIVRKEVNSYRQLPRRLYQVQVKFSDEIRPRFGLLRAKEFLMKDAFSFDADDNGLEASYQAMCDVYHNICGRLGLSYRCVEADAGAFGGFDCKEFAVLAGTGEDSIVFCDGCGYGARQNVARSRLEVYPQDAAENPMETVYGKGLIGVEPLAEFLKIPVWKTTKTLLFQADEKLVAVMVRGDCDVDEDKVKRFLKCSELKLASPEVVKEFTGAEVGYAGPVGLPAEVQVIADHYTNDRVNFECGANQTDYHNINVNFGRDFPWPAFDDFMLTKGGNLCPQCGGRLEGAQAIGVGHVVKLGTALAEKMTCFYLGRQGKNHPVVMGCYGMGITKLAAAIVEQHHDDNGIVWPSSVAPFQVHLIALNLESDEVRSEVEKVYDRLSEEGVEVLLDDRDLRAGEKFADADLLGMPVRLTMSKRTYKEQRLEFKLRNSTESELLTYDEALERIRKLNRLAR